MDKKKATIAATAVALLSILALAMSSVVMSDNLAGADDAEEVGEDEAPESMGAGGGGWFASDDAKNTFGFYLNASDWAMSELVLQARDLGVKIEAYQFDSVSFAYDPELGTGSADASGRAWVGGVDGSFHLIVEDNGGRDVDRFMLEVTTDVTNTWDVTGLGGGQIWVVL